MTQLGGYAVYLTPKDIQLGERESVADIARNLERWVDLIMARTFAHDTLVELARARRGAGDQRPLRPAASLPGADRLLHAAREARPPRRPARRLHRRRQQRRQLVDERGGQRFGFSFVLACPPGYEPHEADVRQRRAPPARRSTVTHDAAAAAARRRRPLHRRLDQHGPGGRSRSSAGATSPPTRSTPTLLRRATPGRASSCTACRRTAARRSPTR